jgi:transcriptional regulator with XRE-family HTH domain
MSKDNIANKLRKTSKKDNKWLEKAKYRQENEAWMNISFNIAIKINSVLKSNRLKKMHPKSQKELAEVLECSPQYVNKLLKGTENLQIKTICDIELALNTKLIKTIETERSFSQVGADINYSDFINMMSEEIDKRWEHINLVWDTIFSSYESHNYAQIVSEVSSDEYTSTENSFESHLKIAS